jgi:hypothetical protein
MEMFNRLSSVPEHCIVEISFVFDYVTQFLSLNSGRHFKIGMDVLWSSIKTQSGIIWNSRFVACNDSSISRCNTLTV